jgi:hypothetical protein
MHGEFLYLAHEWVPALVFLALMAAASATGFALGRRLDHRNSPETRSQILTVEAGILGVLGLMLGFTMSMAVSRFDARKHLVLEEAQAVGTAWLRTQLLPPAEGKPIAELLSEYTDIRTAPNDGPDIYDRILAARRESARLQDAFWRRAVMYAQKNPNPVLAGLLLQSLNQVIDLDAARWMAFENHVPDSVIYVIAVLGVLAALSVGYSFGLAGSKNIFTTLILLLEIVLVLMVIVDLDRPRGGFIRVSQQPMLDLQKQMHSR